MRGWKKIMYKDKMYGTNDNKLRKICRRHHILRQKKNNIKEWFLLFLCT